MKAVRTAVIIVGAAALAAATAGVGLGVAAGASASFSLAATASTLGISTTLLAGGALTGAAVLAQALPPAPSAGGSQTKWKADPYAGIPYVMGRTLVAGDIRAKRGSGGSNPYEHFVTVLSLGPIAGIDTAFANKTTLNFPGGVTGTPSGFYFERIWQTVQLGRTPEPAAMQPLAGTFPDWTAAHKLSGYAATLVTMLYDAKGKNTLTTEPAMSWIIRGVLVYDPRLDSTYPGGNGPCRALDESTYVYSEDPHLHGLTWALGRHQNGRRVAGIGAALAQIDVASFVEGANLNDARGWKVGGQITTRPDTPWNSLKSILQAGGATPVFAGGIISCINRAPRVSLATITRDDIVGDCSFTGTQPRRTRINGMVPSYRSEAHDWQMIPAKGVLVARWVGEDGGERVKEQSFPLVQDVDQVTQLATYEVADAREAGPGSIPLKPWWLNYRLGDCVTFSPEDGWNVKVMVMGRDLDAQTGTVTYTVRTETDEKHPFALGATGIAPATAGIAYDTSVPAPGEADWALAGVTLTANGVSIPALVVTGAAGNGSADAVLFEQRPYLSGGTDDAGWSSASVEAADTVRKEFGTVTPGTSYEVAVRYRVRGVIGDRRVLGPATAGVFATSRVAHQIIVATQSATYPVTSTATEINVAAFNAYIDDGTQVAFPVAQMTGLTAATPYVLLWSLTAQAYSVDDAAGTGILDPNNVIVRYVTTANADGTYPDTPTAPGGDGGSGYGGGNGCPTEDAMFLTANAAGDGPGDEIRAGDVVVGTIAWTRHDVTGEWGAFPVAAVTKMMSPVVRAEAEQLPQALPDVPVRALRTSPRHRIGWAPWTRMEEIGRPDGEAIVVRITVAGAATYVVNGVGSHNLKPIQQQDR